MMPVKCFYVMVGEHRLLIDVGWNREVVNHGLRHLNFGLWFASELPGPLYDADNMYHCLAWINEQSQHSECLGVFCAHDIGGDTNKTINSNLKE